ncbi:MAG: DUF4046 domain-containing protein [Candidatus Nanoarchaeia archaeon]|nr:DUF4046 domain-containing protein [Candidatus Nanoarchaeia archaeon]MDD5741263.1 DUF4046 domain-containing protein [Candidatus Nanoarchaeia archaeon]
MQFDQQILEYEPSVRTIAYWYLSLWPRGRDYDIEDLLQAGRKAVWNVSEKRPEKINHPSYVKAAIRYSILNEIKKLSSKHSKIREVHLITQYDDEDKEYSLIDLLPSYSEHEERLANLDEICNYVSNNFSREDADSIMGLADRCDKIFDLNLSLPPQTNIKDKVRIVTKMNLSDQEMITYANVLTGAIDRWPDYYIKDQVTRARKYISFLLENLNIPPEEFALMGKRMELLDKYGLYTFFRQVYKHNISLLMSDVFPEIEPCIIRRRNRWKGREGIMNAYYAIGWLARKTKKQPSELTREDFKRHKLLPMIRILFEDSMRNAIEFRYPGTYPGMVAESKKLWDTFKDGN